MATVNSSSPQGDNHGPEVKTNIITLTRFLTEGQAELGDHATGDFT